MLRRKFLGGLLGIPVIAKMVPDLRFYPAEAEEVVLPPETPPLDLPIPPGTVIPYAGTCPEGWLPCDGRPVFRSEYPLLYEAIGHAYGYPSDAQWENYSPMVFRLPDLGRTAVKVESSHDHSTHTQYARADHRHSFAELYSPPFQYVIKT